MKVIVVNNVSKGESIPDGGIVFWSGNASELPAGWTLYNSAADAFIMGTNTSGINLTKQGSASHVHTTPSTDSKGKHKHSINVSVGNSSGYVVSENTGSGSSFSNYIHSHNISGGYVDEDGEHAHDIDNTGSANNLPPYTRYYLMKSNEAHLPIGAILIWTKNINQIPEGWHLCDGSTQGDKILPDIRGRFIYVPNSDTAKGTIGGSSSHTHNAPYTKNAGDHRHLFFTGRLEAGSGNDLDSGTDLTIPAGDHIHYGIYSSTDIRGNHRHLLPNINVVEILPPYIKLYFIVKVS